MPIYEIFYILRIGPINTENRAYSWNILNTIYKNICFVCVKETSPLVDDLFIITKHMLTGKKLIIIIFRSYIFLCLPLYNSNFRYLEIKSLVPRTLNLWGPTVCEKTHTINSEMFVGILFLWKALKYMGLEVRNPVFGSLLTTQAQTSLISIFVIRFWERTLCKLATSEISIFLLVSVAEDTGLKLALSETPKTGFVASRPIHLRC